jgi:hypothetical protein
MAAKRLQSYIPPTLVEFSKVLQPQDRLSTKDLTKQSSTSLFGELKTLESLRIPFRNFQPIFGVDKRYPSATFQRFLQLNKASLRFLDIVATLEDDGSTLVLTSSRYVGCVPIKSPANGKVVSNLLVTGRFNEDISELLSVIGDTILPEFNDELSIVPNEAVKPPLYFECANYIDKYIEAQHANWRKFDSRMQVQKNPTSGTDWMNYALRSVNPLEALRYPNRCNYLSKDHPEWRQLNYVLEIAIAELEAPRTSQRAKAAYAEKLMRLKASMAQYAKQETRHLQEHVSDPPVIKELKVIGNIILSDNASNQKAWRLDFAEFFERYVQYLVHTVAVRKGAHDLANPKYGITGSRLPKWSLRYLEPDLVLYKDGVQYVIDAKYKSHIYNVGNNTDDLRDVFRHDLHQLLAYCSFSTCQEKFGFLVYPAKELTEHTLRIRSSVNGLTNTVTLLGILLKKTELPRTIDYMKERFVLWDKSKV